jgi:2-polyprenyl-3-methyl-5-hydroxy-6-metoxy-1,4-benzoquinol methylase
LDAKTHWEQVYTTKAPEGVSWYRERLDTSLAMIDRAAESCSASIIDVGGGESTLVDDLLLRGYQNVTVLDVSQTAIDFTKRRLGSSAEQVDWVAGDITEIELQLSVYDIWHDRAVFHFLTVPGQRAAYLRQVVRSVKPGGHVMVGTFGAQGPTRCSGLETLRYDAESLHREFGPRFRLFETSEELHRTPLGAVQQFLYCHFRID